MTRAEALQMASSQTLDLVEVSPMAEPPVVRVMDFGKFLFEQNKKAHAAKRKQKPPAAVRKPVTRWPSTSHVRPLTSNVQSVPPGVVTRMCVAPLSLRARLALSSRTAP